MREIGQVDIHRQGMGMVKYGDEGVGSGHVKHSDMGGMKMGKMMEGFAWVHAHGEMNLGCCQW